MAERVDDGEFWLPPEFLTDDDIFTNRSSKVTFKSSNSDGFGSYTDGSRSFPPYEFPNGFGPFGFASDVSSPVESVVCSTETESDEDDRLAGLTLKMLRSTLNDEFSVYDRAGLYENNKSWVSSCSARPVHCATGKDCQCRQGLNKGRPNYQASISPPWTWGPLYATAGENARTRMNEESYGFNSGRTLFGSQPKPFPVSALVNNPSLDPGYYSQQSFQHRRLQSARFQLLKQKQIMKQQCSTWSNETGRYQQHQVVVHNGGRTNDFIGSRSNCLPQGLSPSAWPPLQQSRQIHNGSGMRAVFLGNPAGRRECAGTGVFLPRQVGASVDTRKKPACSTVLLPARVVHALNLNFEDVGFEPKMEPRSFLNQGFTPANEAPALRDGNGNAISHHHRRNLRAQQAVNHETRLPHDWTY